MKIVKCSNGVNLMYDDEIKPGDLITAYKSGYHIFIKYEDRGKGETPLAYYQKKYGVDGKPCKSKKVLTCDASYCRMAVDRINEEIEKKKKEIIALEKIKATL